MSADRAGARLGAPEGSGACTTRWLFGVGIAVALAANVEHGPGHGLIGAAGAA